jgi:ACR3 family arsenite efflux pump ArsB
VAVELVLAAGAMALGYTTYRVYPEATRKWYERYKLTASTLWRLIGLLLAVVFLGSGNPVLMLFGAFGILTLTLALIYDLDLDALRDYSPF